MVGHIWVRILLIPPRLGGQGFRLAPYNFEGILAQAFGMTNQSISGGYGVGAPLKAGNTPHLEGGGTVRRGLGLRTSAGQILANDNQGLLYFPCDLSLSLKTLLGQ